MVVVYCLGNPQPPNLSYSSRTPQTLDTFHKDVDSRDPKQIRRLAEIAGAGG